MSWSNHKEFAHDWIESWNAHDLDRIMSHYADNVTLTSGKVQQVLGQEGGAVRGKANLRAYFEKRLAMPPKVHFDLVRIYSGVNTLVLEFHASDGRHVAEYMAFNRDGLVERVAANAAIS